jgi:hypothetical protein
VRELPKVMGIAYFHFGSLLENYMSSVELIIVKYRSTKRVLEPYVILLPEGSYTINILADSYTCT